MADRYKEGVDFEWVKGNAGNTKVRRFFTKAEKDAKKAPAKSPRPKAKPEQRVAAKPSAGKKSNYEDGIKEIGKTYQEAVKPRVSGASRSTDGKVKDKKPVAGVSGASRSVAGKVSDQAKRNAKRAKEPVAAWLYDKAYGKDKWKPKK